jgi:hypothetical protein
LAIRKLAATGARRHGLDHLPERLRAAVFSLVIYFWAMRVALTRERIEEMIGDVVLPEADPGVA